MMIKSLVNQTEKVKSVSGKFLEKYFRFFQNYHLYVFETRSAMTNKILEDSAVFTNYLMSKIKVWKIMLFSKFAERELFPEHELILANSLHLLVFDKNLDYFEVQIENLSELIRNRHKYSGRIYCVC